MIKKENTRLLITISKDYYEKLKVVMFDLKTRQPSKALKFLLENYKKL